MRGGFGKMIYGVTRAVQTTFAGMVEVSHAFDPWGTKR